MYLETSPGVFKPWNGEEIAGFKYPVNIEQLWSDSALAALGLYRPMAADAVPTGKVVVRTSVQRQGHLVKFVNTLANAPASQLTRIPKDVVWRRATDQEAEAMEFALSQQPIRIRRIYEGATHIETGDELFSLLESAMTSMFGAAKAKELLAPTQ